jgi:outer membrane autotransporter protein
VENDDDVLGDSMVVNSAELGGYWRLVNGGLSAHARAGAAWVGVTNERAVAVYDGDDARILLRTASGKWSGAALSGKTSIGYEARFGRFYARPTASLDYLYLREGAYRERGGGDAVDLDVEARTTQRVDGFIGVITGVRFGEEAWWGPEVQAGWRQVAGSGGKTIGRFASGTDDFTLLADEVTGGGLVLRGAVKGEGEGGAFTVEGGAQMRDDIAVYDLRLSAHFRF